MIRKPPHLPTAFPRAVTLATAVALLATVSTASGCYFYTVEKPDSAPVNEYREHDVTASSSVWGLVEDDAVIADGCRDDEALDQVRVTNNYGYALITVFSLGLYSLMDVNYRCAEAVIHDNSGI